LIVHTQVCCYDSRQCYCPLQDRFLGKRRAFSPSNASSKVPEKSSKNGGRGKTFRLNGMLNYRAYHVWS